MTALMAPRSAQYLLRFDDLCATGDHPKWCRFLPLIERYRLQPILAVIPDNRDPALIAGPPDSDFWDQMRAMQASGATIGLHGYQHLCHAGGKSLIGFHQRSEFAGVTAQWQRWWIQLGLAILRDQGLDARVWVAPRHGFDRATLYALRGEGLLLVSDGLATRPFRWLGVSWLPQQLWGPVEKKSGLWTICVHPATATDEDVRILDRFLERFASQFTSVDRVLAEWPIHTRSLEDRTFHGWTQTRMRISKFFRAKDS